MSADCQFHFDHPSCVCKSGLWGQDHFLVTRNLLRDAACGKTLTLRDDNNEPPDAALRAGEDMQSIEPDLTSS